MHTERSTCSLRYPIPHIAFSIPTLSSSGGEKKLRPGVFFLILYFLPANKYIKYSCGGGKNSAAPHLARGQRVEPGLGSTFSRRRLAGADAEPPRSQPDPLAGIPGAGALRAGLSSWACALGLYGKQKPKTFVYSEVQKVWLGVLGKGLEILAGKKFGD